MQPEDSSRNAAASEKEVVKQDDSATSMIETDSKGRKRPLEAIETATLLEKQEREAEEDIMQEESQEGIDNQVEEEVVEETAFKPVYNMPEGMHLEWNDDDMSAILKISSSSKERRVCLVGRARIQVVEGSIEVLGHVMNANDGDNNESTTLVTSPFWSSWMTIEATTKSLPCTIRFHSVRGKRSFRVVAPTRPIVIPDDWRSAATALVQQFCPPVNDETSQIPRHSAALARTTIDFDDENDDNLHYDHPRQVCMITGAKGVGKSTFLRYMANRLLSNQPQHAKGVAILDADVGQPELAPPGMFRLAVIQQPLLQPPYWNLVHHNASEDDDANSSEIRIVSSIFFGADTSKSDPTRYVEGIQLLMKHYEEGVATKSPTPIPLLINMDGWVKGIGFQILTALVNSLQPTHLVQITGDTRAQTFDISSHLKQELQDSIQIIPFSSCTTMNEASICRIPALTWRNFRWATYFLPGMLSTFDAWDFVSAKELQTGWIATVGTHFTSDNVTDEDELNDECRLGLALAKETPFCVPMEAAECFVVGSDYEDSLRIREEEASEEKERKHNLILQAMNGSIVALCTNTATMESLGYGILRSIDWRKRLLYIIVPASISSSALPTVKALVKGNLPLPFAMLYRGVYAESFPYLTTLNNTTSSNILGSAPMKSRNNIIRKSTANAARK
ncbi:MAG: hypothetical protein SGILL_007598 [Bacillariaceae sp.]